MPANEDSAAANESNTTLSALHDNIQRNKQNSYYFAHAPRNTGEQPAPLPVHVVLERCEAPPAAVVETIFNYQFLDENDKVKVYLPLEGVAAATTDESVTCSFLPRSLEVCIRDYRPGKVLKLAVKELGGEVKPEECSFKRMTNKVVVTLKKAGTSHWSKLSAK